MKLYYETIPRTKQYLHSLSVAFGSIMCFTEHLAIFDICCASPAPSSYMVSVHFGKLPTLAPISVVTICISSAMSSTQ